jgi:hypothetical protein
MAIKDKRLKLIWKAKGYMDAQLVKAYLESYGIEAFDFEESVGKSYGLTSTSLGEVEIYVRQEQAKEAEECIQVYKSLQDEEAED